MFISKVSSISKKAIIILSIVALMASVALTGCSQNKATKENDSTQNATSDKDVNLNVAVEYTDHAAAFYYAHGKNLFSGSGIKINDVKVYASGVGVAAAFTKGGFNASYMCLVPAIFTYANGGVPIKIIAGTHKNGYGLIVNSAKIQKLSDLEKNGIKIANGPEGTSTDFLQKILIEKENLDSEKIMSNTVRMNAAKQLMALRNGKVDAIFVPEHFATLAASFPGMKMLLKSTDVWPDMQGSILVVTEDLLKNHPKTVEKLKEINKKSIQLINENPQDAAAIVSKSLNINQNMVKEETKSPEANLEVTPEIAAASMSNLKMTSDISIEEVQAVIDKMYAMGYLKKSFDAKEIIAID